MIRRFLKLYFPLFKHLILLNVLMSVLAARLFLQEGFNVYGVYIIASSIKIVGYALSLAVERMFYAKRGYFFKNVGLSYSRIFAYILLLDLGYYIIILLICWIVKSFI